MPSPSGRRQSPVVARRELRRRVTAARSLHFASREEAANALGWTVRVQNAIETGQSLPSEDQLARMFTVLDVEGADHDLWRRLTAAARTRGWWDTYDDADLSRSAKRFIGYEAGATKVRVFAGAFVAALLQTREYRTSLLTNQVGTPAPERIERLLEVHDRRKAVLEGPKPLEYHMILDESALYRHAGPGVIAGQLDHLIRLAESASHVTIQVVTYDAGLYRALSDTMTLLWFGRPGDGLGYVERATGQDDYVEGPDLYGYSSTFEELAQERARTPDDTLDTLRAARELAKRSER